MASPVRRESKASAGSAAASAPEQALAKLGLVRDIDLALHLPLRYEDETKLVPIASLHDGETGQVITKLLQRAAKQHGAAVVCVTHDPRLEAYADRVIHIEDGRILDDRRRSADARIDAAVQDPLGV